MTKLINFNWPRFFIYLQRKSLDIALGFAAGVMIAASFWSLLAPAIDLAKDSKYYGKKGEYAFIPVAGGFLLGSIFVFATDKIISYLGINSSHMMIGIANDKSRLLRSFIYHR